MTGISPKRSQTLVSQTTGTGPDLVLLHGGAGSWTHWARNIPELSKQFRVCAIDLPGFGGSPDFPPELDDDSYFKWVADAILTKAIGRVCLVGFSFGGSVAAATAQLLGSRLAALTLVGPGSFGIPGDRKLSLRRTDRADGYPQDERDAARHNLNEIMFADPSAIDEAAIDLHMHNLEHSRFNSRRISWQDRLARDLAPLTCPVQFIWGAKDRMATPSVSHRVELCRRLRPDVRIDTIPLAGHWVQYESPVLFDECLLDFLLTATSAADATRRALAALTMES